MTTKNIKPNYKKTPVGIIPEDWAVKEMGDLSKVNQGLQIPIAERFLEKVEDSYFYITNEFLKKNSKKNYYIKNPPKSVICDADDILMTRTGNTGTVVTGVTGAFHNNFFKIDFDKKLLLKDYLYDFLISPRTQFNLLVLAGNSTIPDLNHSEFYKLKLPIPPLPEQKAIADCLSTWDRAIEKQTQLIHAKKEFKKGLMQGFFNGRLSIINGQLVKAKEGQDFTEDWEEVKLGEIGEFKTSSVNKKIEENEIKVRLLNYMDVYRNTHITSKIKFQVTSAKTTQIESTQVKIGDILFTPSSETPDDIGHSAVVIENLENVVYSYHLVRMRPKKNKLDIDFSGYVFNKEDILNEFSRRATGSTRYTLSIKDFKDIITKIPNLEFQNAIAQVLQSADKEIELLEQKLAQLQKQKKGLMQVLLTGEKRLV